MGFTTPRVSSFSIKTGGADGVTPAWFLTSSQRVSGGAKSLPCGWFLFTTKTNRWRACLGDDLPLLARMAELVDALGLGSSGATREGSSPFTCIIL